LSFKRLFYGIASTGALSLVLHFVLRPVAETIIGEWAFSRAAKEIAGRTGLPEGDVRTAIEEWGVPLIIAGVVVYAIFHLARKSYAPKTAPATAEQKASLPPLPIATSRPALADLVPEIGPDWAIRDLFFHIQPSLLDNEKAKAWEQVGRDVMDRFSTGQLRVWGRRVMPPARRREPLAEIDDRKYWARAQFTYWFLKNDGDRLASHVAPISNWRGSGPMSPDPDYADLQVNHAQALTIWPLDTLILFEEAARLFLEAMERAGIDDMVRTRYSSPEVILTHFKTVMVTEARKGNVVLRGKRPPSTQTLPISIDDLRDLAPREGDKSNLFSLSRARPVDFTDVQISRRDLDRLIEDRIALLKRVDEGLRQ
jgi:hypothetical protein